MPKNKEDSPPYDDLMLLDGQVCFGLYAASNLGTSLSQLISALER